MSGGSISLARFAFGLPLLIAMSASCAPESGNSNALIWNGTYPVHFEELEGWHGLRIANRQVGQTLTCRVDMPERFGASDVERSLLVAFVNAERIDIRGALCTNKSTLSYQALEQLLNLAVRHADANAARLLLSRGMEADGLRIDGEISEVYYEKYLIPLLEGFGEPKAVLTDRISSNFAEDVCALLSLGPEIVDEPLDPFRVEALAVRLNRLGVISLSQSLGQCARRAIDARRAKH